MAAPGAGVLTFERACADVAGKKLASLQKPMYCDSPPNDIDLAELPFKVANIPGCPINHVFDVVTINGPLVDLHPQLALFENGDYDALPAPLSPATVQEHSPDKCPAVMEWSWVSRVLCGDPSCVVPLPCAVHVKSARNAYSDSRAFDSPIDLVVVVLVVTSN